MDSFTCCTEAREIITSTRSYVGEFSDYSALGFIQSSGCFWVGLLTQTQADTFTKPIGSHRPFICSIFMVLSFPVYDTYHGVSTTRELVVVFLHCSVIIRRSSKKKLDGNGKQRQTTGNHKKIRSGEVKTVRSKSANKYKKNSTKDKLLLENRYSCRHFYWNKFK